MYEEALRRPEPALTSEREMTMEDIAEISRRLGVLEDERSLRALLTRYAFNADLGRSREYAALYAEDGAIDVYGSRYEGQDDILMKFITGVGHRSIEGRCQHFTQGPLIFNINGDQAEAEGYSLVLVREGSIPNPLSGQLMPDIRVYTASLNHWRFARINGDWKIVERIVRPIGDDAPAEVISRITQ